MKSHTHKPFTGYTMAMILVGFFGFVAAVNFTMAKYASATFGGVVVENSYVASQEFNSWLENAKVQDALGWEITSTWRADRRIVVNAVNVPKGATMTANARHPLGRAAVQPLTMIEQPDGRFVSEQRLPDGRWSVELIITAGTHVWRGKEALR